MTLMLVNQIGDAILTALNDSPPVGTPATVDATGEEVATLPAMILHLITDETVGMHGSAGDGTSVQLRPPPGPVSKCRAVFVLEVRAETVDGTPARKAPDPHLAWAIQQLMGSRLGGLAHNVYRTRVEYQQIQKDRLYVRAAMEFCVDYQTRVADATANR